MLFAAAGAFLAQWLWAIFTVCASAAQTARNAMQRDLTKTLGTAGATHVRFLFALPFACAIAGCLVFGLGKTFPSFDAVSLAWTAGGAATQTIATALMLAGMKQRSFSVMVAYTKTEPVFIAIIAVAILRESLTITALAAVFIATFGVMLMSWPKRDADQARAVFDWRPAAMGLVSGLFFALSANCYRAALLRAGTGDVLMDASAVMLMGQAMQAGAILLWLAAFDRPLLGAIAREWKRSLFAGSMGAIASLFWFMAFALISAAKVRTLALIEVPMALFVARGIFNQTTTPREIAGMALIAAGIVLLLNG